MELSELPGLFSMSAAHAPAPTRDIGTTLCLVGSYLDKEAVASSSLSESGAASLGEAAAGAATLAAGGLSGQNTPFLLSPTTHTVQQMPRPKRTMASTPIPISFKKEIRTGVLSSTLSPLDCRL